MVHGVVRIPRPVRAWGLSMPTYRLEPRELEEIFRKEGLVSDKRVLFRLLILAALFHFISIPLDQSVLGGSREFLPVLGIRLASAAIALATLVFIRGATSPRLVDDVVSVWAFLLLLGVLVADAHFPPDYVFHLAWDLLLTLAVYSLLPLPLVRQAILGFMFTAGILVLCSTGKSLGYKGALGDILVAFFCANLLGLFVSWEVQRWRRLQFQALRKETELRTELERTLLELRSLRGIIPICSHCKNIRTDAGEWERVETYVRTHADAEFSHGICPRCLERHFPGMSDGG